MRRTYMASKQVSRDTRSATRIARHIMGHARVTVVYDPIGLPPETPWRAECWTWMRTDQRWELMVVGRGTTERDALIEMTIGVLETAI